MKIDWTNPQEKVSKYFSVKECLWLPSWKRMANEEDGLTEEIKNNLIELCNKLDIVRESLNTPINVHCMFRPEEYNKLVKGAPKSSHRVGKACDWDALGLNCDDVRAKLENKLQEWDMRMERMPGGNWVHLDTTSVLNNGNRYFIP